MTQCYVLKLMKSSIITIKHDENIRYDNVFMDFSGKYTFIRCNPEDTIDKYNTSRTNFFKQEWIYQKTILKNIYTELNIV